MTRVRFQSDADLKQAIVTGARRRQPHLDFQSANEAGLEGLKDLEVLAMAAKDGRILITHDRKTMPSEFGQFTMTQSSSGILIISQSLPISEAIDAIGIVRAIANQTPDGRVRRMAEEAVQKVQKAAGSDQATKKLQEELDQLKKDNQDLKSRLENLEAKAKKGEA